MLIPKEHGAYGQLLIPLVAALLIGRPDAGAYLLAAAGTAAFLAHEGLLVQLGQRGSRAARELRVDARKSVGLFGGFAAVAGVVSLTALPVDARSWLLLPAGLAVAVAVAVFAQVERTTAGELLVGTALSSLSVPVAVAGEVALPSALTLLAVFASVFGAATVSVRAVIGRVAKAGGPPLAGAALLTLALLALLAVLSVQGRLASVAPFAAMPVCAVSLGLCARPPSPKYLRQVGWTLVGATILTAAILVAGLAHS